MAQYGKSAARRGKPSYIMSIVGVTLVLFLLGLVGWLVINANKLGDYFRENVEVRAFLRGDISSKDSTALMESFATKAYVKSFEFVDKETAKKIYLDNNNEDWSKVLDYNPLPNSINFHLRRNYVDVDSLHMITEDLKKNVYISDIQYPEAVVSNLNQNIQRISMALLVVALIIAFAVIILIDNTIRLAMFSNRFLIKTMQMVGATRWFIAKPLNVRAIVNGAISALIAIVLVYILITTAQKYWPDLAVLHDTQSMLLLFALLLIIGVSITFVSTYRSVLKYLKMKLDELY